MGMPFGLPSKYALGHNNLILVRKSPAICGIGKISEVASVRMGRVFPDGMWVEVRERKPFAVLSRRDQVLI